MLQQDDQAHRRYWRANVRMVLILLAIWFSVAYLGGIFFAEQLNTIRLGGFKLGFWIAQQGSIVVFILLVLTYCLYMNRLDRIHGVDEEQT